MGICTHFSRYPTTHSCQRSATTEARSETQPSYWALHRGPAAAASQRLRPKAQYGSSSGFLDGSACLQLIRTRSDGRQRRRRRRHPGGDPTQSGAKPCIDVLVNTLGGADQIQEMAAQSYRERWQRRMRLQMSSQRRGLEETACIMGEGRVGQGR